jgi:hypothetical protein
MWLAVLGGTLHWMISLQSTLVRATGEEQQINDWKQQLIKQ